MSSIPIRPQDRQLGDHVWVVIVQTASLSSILAIKSRTLFYRGIELEYRSSILFSHLLVRMPRDVNTNTNLETCQGWISKFISQRLGKSQVFSISPASFFFPVGNDSVNIKSSSTCSSSQCNVDRIATYYTYEYTSIIDVKPHHTYHTCHQARQSPSTLISIV